MAAVIGVHQFERLFREAAGIDVDKDDLRRLDDFVNQKLYDLLLRGQANAKANDRDLIEPWDIPITKGLQERVDEFEALDASLNLDSILDQLTNRPLLDMGYTQETIDRLPHLFGGLTIALGRSFKAIHPDLKNPQTQDWDQVTAVFNLIL